MLEIRNVNSTPIDIVLSPVQKKSDYIQISIPENGSFSSNVNTGCSKFLKLLKDQKVVWEGVIPTCISQPIFIDSLNNRITYKGNTLVNIFKPPSYITDILSSINSTHIMMALVMILAIAGFLRYKKYGKLM